MALQDNALTTVEAVESELGISSGSADAILGRYINEFSDLFESETGRPWHRDDSYTEAVKSVGDTQIQVSRRPIHSIGTISVKGDTVDGPDYAIEDADAGIIRFDDGFWESTGVAIRRVKRHTRYFEQRVNVTYDGGYVTPEQAPFGSDSDPRDLPFDIERAIITCVVSAYRQQGKPGNIESESIGSASVSFTTQQDQGQPMGQAVSGVFRSAVKRHKDWSVL